MKIVDIVYDLLIEEVINDSLYRKVYPKWIADCPELEQLRKEEIDEKLKSILKRHTQIKGSLNMNMPSVISFLTRYSGLHGREKITLDILKDVTRIPFKRLVEFLEEYGDFSIDVPCIKKEERDEGEENRLRLKEIFKENGLNGTLQKINESKRMWEGNENCVINDGPFRVYQIMNQEQAIRMGYYYHQIYAKNKILGGPDGPMNLPWCVTARGSGTPVYENYDENGPIGDPIFKFAYDSMYGNYRNYHKRTFYFIIDESKPETNKWHIAALQTLEDGNFKITNMYNNPGEQNAPWDDFLVDLYPNIARHKEVLKWREFDQKEIESKSFIDIVNEIPGNMWEFKGLNPQQKKRYIDAGGILKTKSSWISMTPQLRDDYIRMIDGATLQIKISTAEFLFEILKTNKKYLVSRLAIMNPPKDITDLILYYMTADFKIMRSNIENNNIKLMSNLKGSKRAGIFDLDKNDWFTMDGVKYEPEYKSIEVIDLLDSSNNRYSVDVFSKSTTPDQTSFYSLWLTKDFKDKSSFPSYFISKKKWDQLIQDGKLIPDDTEEEFEYGNNNIAVDVDIKEMFK
jgi:hypothetical protein